MNKFDRLIKFLQDEVETKGADVIADEIKTLMHEKNLTEGPTLANFLHFSFNEYYSDECIAKYSLEGHIADTPQPLGYFLGKTNQKNTSIHYNDDFITANDDNYPTNSKAA